MSTTNYLGLNIPDKNSKGRVVTDVFEPNFTKIDQNAEVVDIDKNAIWGGEYGGYIQDTSVTKVVGERYIDQFDRKAYECLVPSHENTITNYQACNVKDNLMKLNNLSTGASLFHNSSTVGNAELNVPTKSQNYINNIESVDDGLVILKSGVYNISMSTNVVGENLTQAAIKVNDKIVISKAADIDGGDGQGFRVFALNTICPLNAGDTVRFVVRGFAMVTFKNISCTIHMLSSV